MALPSIPLPRDVVVVDGVDIPVRGLSRAAALRLHSLADDPDKADTFVLAFGTETPEDEAAEWRESVPFQTVDVVVNRILELSAFVEGAQKSD